MKKQNYMFGVLAILVLLSIFSVLAVQPSQPNVNTLISQSALGQPIPPSTDDGNCVLYTAKEYSCSGNILLYKECMPTMSGNVWQPQSQTCPNTCQLGKCVTQTQSYILYIIGTVIVIFVMILIIYFATRKKHRRYR